MPFSQLILLISMPRVAEVHPLSGKSPPRCEAFSTQDRQLVSYEPGSFEMFAQLVLAESFCVPGGAPHFAAPSRIHWVTPFLDAELNAPVRWYSFVVIFHGLIKSNRMVGREVDPLTLKILLALRKKSG